MAWYTIAILKTGGNVPESAPASKRKKLKTIKPWDECSRTVAMIVAADIVAFYAVIKSIRGYEYVEPASYY